MQVALSRYVRRKRFRSPKNARRAELAAARKRRERLYDAAVAAGYPLALEAEFFRHPMTRYYAQEKSLTVPERLKLSAECAAMVDTPEARAQYLKLRDQVIRAAEEMFT